MKEQTEEEKRAFKEKLKSIQWGVSTKNPGTRRKYYDRERLETTIGDMDLAEETVMEVTEGYGPLRWENGRPYHLDRKTGDYEALSASDLEVVMYGGDKDLREATRSFAVGAGRKSGGSSEASGSEPKHDQEVGK